MTAFVRRHRFAAAVLLVAVISSAAAIALQPSVHTAVIASIWLFAILTVDHYLVTAPRHRVELNVAYAKGFFDGGFNHVSFSRRAEKLLDEVTGTDDRAAESDDEEIF